MRPEAGNCERTKKQHEENREENPSDVSDSARYSAKGEEGGNKRCNAE